MHTAVFADGALEAKSAGDSSHRPFLKGAWSGQITNRTSNGATRAIKSDKNYSYQAQLGVKKVDLLTQTACSRYAKMYFPQQRGAFFEQNVIRKGALNKRSTNGGTDCTQNSPPRGAIAARSATASKIWTARGGHRADFVPQNCIFSVSFRSQNKSFSNVCIQAPFATMLRTRAASTFL